MSHKQRKAMAASELAVILPVLVTFLLGCIDFGRFASRYLAVTSAAQAGALVGSMEPYTPANKSVWTDAIRAAVVQELAGQGGFDPANLTLTITVLNSSADAWEVQVAVGYPFQVLVPWPGIPTQTALNQTVVLRTIRP